MLFPDAAKQAIANTFYDKTVEILKADNTLDEEGGLKQGAFSKTGEFLGNVKFNDLGTTVSELGLTEEIDICITCDISVAVDIDDELFIRYSSVVYQVTNVIPSDSHLTITGKKWPASVSS